MELNIIEVKYPIKLYDAQRITRWRLCVVNRIKLILSLTDAVTHYVLCSIFFPS